MKHQSYVNGTRHRVVHCAIFQKMVRWICHRSRENGSMYVSLWSKCCEVYELNDVCDFLFLTDVKNCGLRWGLSSFESQAWEVIKSFHEVLSAGWARPTMNQQDSLNSRWDQNMSLLIRQKFGIMCEPETVAIFHEMIYKCPHPAHSSHNSSHEKKKQPTLKWFINFYFHVTL